MASNIFVFINHGDSAAIIHIEVTVPVPGFNFVTDVSIGGDGVRTGTGGVLPYGFKNAIRINGFCLYIVCLLCIR